MRFNQSNETQNKTVNLAGGEAYQQTPELELVSILLTSFLSDTFYKSGSDTLKRLQDLIKQVDPIFAAQAAIYARTKYGMRSVTHVVAGELCKTVKGQAWLKDFLNTVVYRPDDILEIAAYYDIKNNPVPAAMKKGLGKALTRFDDYQLAKYQGKTKAVSLVDCVNLFRPKATKSLSKLVNGDLKNTDTWEARLSEAGKAETEEEVINAKSSAWKDLLEKNKLGYFALLRNLKNILEQAPECVDLACERLVNEEVIKKSLVFPFRFLTAKEQFISTHGLEARKIMTAIHKAIDISVSNCPEMPGKTLVALDSSGSMKGKPFRIGSMFAAALYLKNNADLLLFDTKAGFVNLAGVDSVGAICSGLESLFTGGGTDFKLIFLAAEHAKIRYDRIVILSDMQAWVGYNCPTKEYNHYKFALSADPYIYSFDLNGHGSMQFPERNVVALAGFSDKVFDIMKTAETDKTSLIKEIKQVEFRK